jgi:hypothetical protein
MTREQQQVKDPQTDVTSGSRNRTPSQRRPVRRSHRTPILLALAGLVVVAVAVIAVVYVTKGRSSGQVVASNTGSTGQTSTQASSQSSQLQALSAYASCMREKGDPGFPDPNNQGNFGAITPGSPADPNSSAFKAAQPSCQSLMPAQSQQQQQQNQSQAVKFAACMRSHGVPNFPDPNSQSGFLVRGVDSNSPQFKAALQSCQSLLPGSAAAAP